MSLSLLLKLNGFLPTTCFSVAVLCAELFASHKVWISKWSVTVLSSFIQVLVLAGIKGTVTQCSSLPKVKRTVANADSVHRGVFLVPCYLTMENHNITNSIWAIFTICRYTCISPQSYSHNMQIYMYMATKLQSKYADIHVYSHKATVTICRYTCIWPQSYSHSLRTICDKTGVESLLESGE